MERNTINETIQKKIKKKSKILCALGSPSRELQNFCGEPHLNG